MSNYVKQTGVLLSNSSPSDPRIRAKSSSWGVLSPQQTVGPLVRGKGGGCASNDPIRVSPCHGSPGASGKQAPRCPQSSSEAPEKLGVSRCQRVRFLTGLRRRECHAAVGVPIAHDTRPRRQKAANFGSGEVRDAGVATREVHRAVLDDKS